MKPSNLFFRLTARTELYNIQPIENVESVFRYGLLSYEMAKDITHKSIAMKKVQDRRNVVKIPNGNFLHQYANVYFDPRNPMLYVSLQENNWICILKIDRTILDIKGAIVSDRNASSAYASFYPPEQGLELLNYDLIYKTYWTDKNYYAYSKKKSIKCAEVLIPKRIPPHYIISVAVRNLETKQKIESIGFDHDIEVEPDLFFRR